MSRLKQQASERANELLKSYNVKINPDTGTYRLVNKSTGKEENVANSGVEVGTSIFAKGRRANKLIGRNLVQASGPVTNQQVVQPANQPQAPTNTRPEGEQESYPLLKRRTITQLPSTQSFSQPLSLSIRPLPRVDASVLSAENSNLKSELASETEQENKTAAEDEMFNKFLQENYAKLPEYRRQRLTPEDYAKYSGYSKTSPEFSSYVKNFDSQKKLLAKPVSAPVGPTKSQSAVREFFKKVLFAPTGIPYATF